MLTGLGEYYCICGKSFINTGAKYHKYIEVMSLESVSAGAEDYKFEEDKHLCVFVACSSLLLT